MQEKILQPHQSCCVQKTARENTKYSRNATILPGGGNPYNGPYGEAQPERGTFFTLQVCERVGISQGEVYERVEKSVI